MIKIGNQVLNPISCRFYATINGEWYIEMEHPIASNWELIEKEAILTIPTPFGNEQYRIIETQKDIDTISCKAVPLFMDAKNDLFVYDIRPTNKNGQDALDALFNGSKYTGHSNIQTLNTAYWIKMNAIECLSSNEDNSFLNRWGGEIRYSDYDVYINDRLGADNGARVELGFNLTGVSEDLDMSDVVTRIIPQAYNGYMLPNEESVDSPLINNYKVIRTRLIEYDDIRMAEDCQEDFEGIKCDTLQELQNQLRIRANKEFENGIDLPSITYDVDLIDLAKTDAYKAYSQLVQINLGDTVKVKNKRLNIETTARVISIVYDCILEQMEELIIGDYEPNYFNSNSDINSTVSTVIDQGNNMVKADKLQGIINLLETQLRAQKDIAQKQDVRAILFEDLDPSSPTYGAMCLGTQGFQIANERNETDTDWDWRTFGTADGFTADLINAGQINTNLIQGYDQLVIKVDDLEEEVESISLSSTLTSIRHLYGITETSDTAPDEWGTYPETIPDNAYLWLRDEYTYSNGSIENGTPILLGQNLSLDNKAIESVTIYYCVSTDGKNPPSSGWQTDMPEWVSDSYIWQKEELTYADDTTSETTPHVIKGSLSSEIYQGINAPSDTTLIWLNTSDNNFYRYQNGEWVMVNDQSEQFNSSLNQVNNQLSATIEQLSTEINSQVSNITTIINETEQTVTDISSQLQQTDSSLSFITSQVESVTDQLTGLVSTNELQQYLRFENGILSIGTSNSVFQMQLSNSELSFWQGSNKVAWINNNELHITSAVVTTSMVVGDDDNRLSLEYVGQAGWVLR